MEFLIRHVEGLPVTIRHLILLPLKFMAVATATALIVILFQGYLMLGFWGFIFVVWITAIWFLAHLYKDILQVFRDHR